MNTKPSSVRHYGRWAQIVLGLLLLLVALPLGLLEGLHKRYSSVIRIGAPPGIAQRVLLSHIPGNYSKIELIEYASSEDVLQAFEWGQIDGMAVSLIEAQITQAQLALGACIVLVTDYGSAERTLYVPPNTHKFELKGKSIGLECTWESITALEQLLRQTNVSASEVSLRFYTQDQLSKALETHAVSAILAHTTNHTPWTTLTVPTLHVIAMRPSVLDRQAQGMLLLMHSWQKSAYYWKQHSSPSTRIPTLEEQVSLLKGPSILTDALPKAHESLVKLGIIPSTTPLTALHRAYANRAIIHQNSLSIP